VKKSATLVSEDEELYRALKRASKAIANIRLEKYFRKVNGKDKVVIYQLNSREFSSWYCGEFRTKKRALNPLIIIGTEDKESFLHQNPILKFYSDEHAYFQIPFSLRKFLDKISNLKHIYDQSTRKLMVKEFCSGYEYKLITHDLKIIKDNKTATIDNLLQVRDFYLSKGDNKTAKIIDKKIEKIQSRDDWEQIALEMKNDLVERLRGTS
jgi:hypothetical protein